MPQTTPEAILEGRKRPFTGAEYLQSLRDGREVYIYGERVEDVTTHPALRNAAVSVAKLYDALHDASTKGVLTAATDTGSGGYTHKFFKAARSRQDVIAQRDAIAAWARITYGWMGRSPDYKAAFLNTLGANADFYGKFADNARAWHKRGQEAVLYLNHALVNPPIDRAKPVEEVKDVYITIQKETDAGIYVSGAKVVATNSALTHYNFLGQNMGQEINDPAMVVMFIAPMNTPGIKLICRASYELAAGATGSPWDYPLTSRFDENDAIFVADNAFIPWENVFIHRDVERLKAFYPRSGFVNGFTLQGCTRLAVKLEFIAGLLLEGRARDRGGGLPRRAGAHRRGDRLAQPVLVALRCHGLQSRAVGQRRGAAQHPRLHRLSPVHDRGLSGGALDRREGDRLGPHLPALATPATSRTRTSTSTSPATCAAPTASTTRSASRP